MNVSNFIARMIRQHSDDLEFIPTATITERWVRQNLYLLQRDRFGYPIGYLLHGNVNDDGTLYIHHACLALEEPDRPSARRTVTALVKRACDANASTILLRCHSNLITLTFWHNLAFIPVAITEAGARNRTALIQYELTLRQRPRQLGSGRLPDGLHPNA